jgi:hypothetical protein
MVHMCFGRAARERGHVVRPRLKAHREAICESRRWPPLRARALHSSAPSGPHARSGRMTLRAAVGLLLVLAAAYGCVPSSVIGPLQHERDERDKLLARWVERADRAPSRRSGVPEELPRRRPRASPRASTEGYRFCASRATPELPRGDLRVPSGVGAAQFQFVRVGTQHSYPPDSAKVSVDTIGGLSNRRLSAAQAACVR